MTSNTQSYPGGELQVTELRPNVRLWQPATDVLHQPEIIAQEPGCEQVFLGLPLGECGGVMMANTVIRQISEDTGVVFGNHEPTHGADANANFVALGAVFDRPVQAIEPGSPYVISAHGAAPSVTAEAQAQGLQVFDVTCPLVHKTHAAILSAKPREHDPESRRARVAYISFGKANHPELVGAAGVAAENDISFTVVADEEQVDAMVQATPVDEKIVVVGQTTNNSDQAEALAAYLQGRAEERGISIQREGKRDVCHTVRDRQRSTREIVTAHNVGSLIVVGSVNSKNTKSLAMVATEEAARTGQTLDIYLTNSWAQLPEIGGTVGVVSGASTLEQNVRGVIDRLAPKQGVIEVGTDTDKDIIFRPVDLFTRRYNSSRP